MRHRSNDLEHNERKELQRSARSPNSNRQLNRSCRTEVDRRNSARLRQSNLLSVFV
jgi:hypothetical protein